MAPQTSQCRKISGGRVIAVLLTKSAASTATMLRYGMEGGGQCPKMVEGHQAILLDELWVCGTAHNYYNNWHLNDSITSVWSRS